MKIDPEFRTLIHPLSAEERAGLEASIVAEGCRDPLVVWSEEDTLVDGHNRMEICQRIGKPWNTSGLSFKSRDAAMAWIIRNQFARRNLTPFQRTELAFKLEVAEAQAAAGRMRAGKRLDPDQISDQGRTLERIAKVAGVSHDTIHKAKVISEKADEATKARLRSGETSINAEYRKIRNPALMLSSESNEWYTPAEVVDAAREVMGGIDLDPASCAEANETVGAACYFDEEADGLAQEWVGRVWLNPPYGGLAAPFIDKLIAEYHAGRTTAAVAIVSAGATTTRWFQPLFDFPLCFYVGRVAFLSGAGERSSNTVGSALAYLGPEADRFAEVFAGYGPVVRRVDVAVLAARIAAT